MSRGGALALLGAACCAAGVLAHPIPSFQGLGDLPGGYFLSSALGVAPDGSAVVGHSRSPSGDEAFRWTATEGMVGLGDLPGGSFHSSAYAVSAGGSAVVGYGLIGGNRWHAYRWTEGEGMVDLGDLPGGYDQSEATGVSADGSVVVGHGSSGHLEAFRWTADDGMVGLGALPGYRGSAALSVSGNGIVIVGDSANESGWERQAFRWTAEGGMVGLGDLPGGYWGMDSLAYGVSADGGVVVGRGESAQGIEAFRWTEATQMVSLGDLPGGYCYSLAQQANADGSLIVGYGTTDVGEEAFIWDAEHGMRRLQTVLESDYALDLTGWVLGNAPGISADGRVIVGYGTNPDGQSEAWLARIPEAHTLLLTIVGALALEAVRRRAGKARGLQAHRKGSDR